MNEHGLTPDDLKRRFAAEIRKASTFETLGVTEHEAISYLKSPEGKIYWRTLIDANPDAPLSEIRNLAIEQISSGRELPRMEIINEPLVKLSAAGQGFHPKSPYYAKLADVDGTLANNYSVNDRFGLPIKSEAPVYDASQIRPHGPTHVFVSQVAPTSELYGQVRHAGGATQYLVLDINQFTKPELLRNVGNDLALHKELVVARGLGPAIAALSEAAPEPGRAPRIAGAGRVLGIAGLALEAYDGAQTVRTASRLRGESNDTAADSALIHFGSRSIGGLGGAAVGAGAGGLATSWSGPGMLIGGGVGGIVGVFGGEKFAQWTDNRGIYNQDDRSGNTWTHDPDQPELGWQRPAPIDPSNDGIDNARRDNLRAPPALANELNYKATTRSMELILGSSPPQRDPFTQPANAQDAASSRPSDWQRSTDDGQWTRTVYGPFVERGMTPLQVETASAERAVQLDQAAAQIVIANANNSPASIAARYEDAYIRNGWAAHGPMPEAVRSVRTDIDTLVASDDNRYQRQTDGRWVSKGMVFTSTADGPLQAELDATRTLLQARLPAPREIPPTVPMTEQARLHDTVTGAYLNAGIEASPGRITAAANAVQATWAANGLDPNTTALSIGRDATGRYGLDSPINSMRLEEDGRTYRIAATTGNDAIRANEPAQQLAPETRVAAQFAAPAIASKSRSPADEDHPDHTMLKQLREGMMRIDQQADKPFDDSSERLCRALLVTCKDDRERYAGRGDGGYSLSSNALDKIDLVTMSKDGRMLFAVQGERDDPKHKIASVDVEQAIRTPVEASDAKLESANTALQHERALVQQQALSQSMDEQQRRGGLSQ